MRVFTVVSLIFCVFKMSAQNSFSDFDTSGNYKPGDNSPKAKKNAFVKPLCGVAYVVAPYTVYRYADQAIKEESQEHTSAGVSGFSKLVSPLGVGNYNAAALGTVGLFSVIVKDKKLQKTVIIWAGSLVINDLLTNQMKITFQRHRPSTGDNYNTFDGRSGSREHKSFISAHTSNVFTTATVFASMYKNKKWVPFVAYGVATLTGISRIYENAHWASDVMAGAFIGFIIAKGMIRLYNWGSKKILILPQAGLQYSSINIAY